MKRTTKKRYLSRPCGYLLPAFLMSGRFFSSLGFMSPFSCLAQGGQGFGWCRSLPWLVSLSWQLPLPCYWAMGTQYGQVLGFPFHLTFFFCLAQANTLISRFAFYSGRITKFRVGHGPAQVLYTPMAAAKCQLMEFLDLPITLPTNLTSILTPEQLLLVTELSLTVSVRT